MAVAVAGARAVGAVRSQPPLLPRGPVPLLRTKPGMEALPRHPFSSPPREKCPP